MGIQINRGVNWIMKKLPESSILNLLNAIMVKSSSVNRWRGSKHNVPSGSRAAMLSAAKKKRKRKIAYQSRRINRLRAA